MKLLGLHRLIIPDIARLLVLHFFIAFGFLHSRTNLIDRP